MLDTLKNAASGWVSQLLLAILVLAFAAWGVADVFTGFGSSSVARVGDTEITVRDFQRTYQRASNNVMQQFGNLTPQQLVEVGLPKQVLDQLVVEATLSDAAHRMGIGISNDQLGKEIASDPTFRSPTGTFDRNYLAQIISAQNMTENDFILAERATYERNQIIDALGGGNATPDAYMQAVHEYRSSERDLSYLVLTAPAAADIADPSDADLAAYFEAHKADWQAPEYRAIRFFVLSPSEIADPAQVTDEDAKKYYDSQSASYRIPAQRQVDQIIFADRAEAEAAVKAMAEGKAFTDVAKDKGLQPSDYDLGFVTRDKIVDPAVAETAFTIAENSISPIVDGRFGPVIVRVRGVQEEIVIPFDDVKADIKQQLALQRAATDIVNLRDSIEDARAGGASISEAAAKFELKVSTVPAMDAGGKDPEGNPIEGLPVAVLAGAFASDVGLENNPVEPDQASFAWYEVTGVTKPRDRTLEEVHDKVVAAWKDSESQKALDAQAADIKKRLGGGETLDAIAQGLSLTVQKAPAVTRLTQPSGDLSAAALASVFAGGKGFSAVAPGVQPKTTLVLTVDAVTEPPYFSGDPTLASIKQQFNTQIATDLIATYATELQRQTDVRYNQAAIAAVVGGSPTP